MSILHEIRISIIHLCGSWCLDWTHGQSKCQLILVLTNLTVEIGNWSGWPVIHCICVPFPGKFGEQQTAANENVQMLDEQMGRELRRTLY
jgi:hypothetical protein